ncbi:MAG: hypothetical protein EB078_01935 [Proteobacteria bacterium]|nr:hypothetical protein [Pseudomonadota bacterium]NDC23462.1 hypothetical protein [Pseudomonadota bacterium]NDD03641.1 hypothetical protein [Pseudomonadota bacterium]NDG26066.1 hypothetical protein [Pseudomonadota bacterium]
MNEKFQKDMERGKELFYAWKLPEAYAIFRRFFDRLPFSPEPAHAIYLSFFIRCLLELGKERELEFYLRQIESLYEKWRTPDLAYQLAEVYCLGIQKNIPKAKKILEGVISDPDAGYLHVKAKLFLAYCYDMEDNDVSSCRKIIDSITKADEPDLEIAVQLWRAKVLRDEGKLSEAEKKLFDTINKLDVWKNWYGFFSAKILLGGLYTAQGKSDKALSVVDEVRKIAENTPFKTIKTQLIALENKIKEQVTTVEIHCEEGISSWRLSFQTRTVEIKLATATAKILEMFLSNSWIDKIQLAKTIFKQEYVAERDDSRIHSHVHSLRKICQQLGLNDDPIQFEKGGYRWLTKIKLVAVES